MRSLDRVLCQDPQSWLHLVPVGGPSGWANRGDGGYSGYLIWLRGAGSTGVVGVSFSVELAPAEVVAR